MFEPAYFGCSLSTVACVHSVNSRIWLMASFDSRGSLMSWCAGDEESMDRLATELMEMLQVRMPLGTRVNKPQLSRSAGTSTSSRPADISNVVVKQQDGQRLEVEAMADFADGVDEGEVDKAVEDVQEEARRGTLFSEEFRERYQVAPADDPTEGSSSPAPLESSGAAHLVISYSSHVLLLIWCILMAGAMP